MGFSLMHSQKKIESLKQNHGNFTYTILTITLSQKVNSTMGLIHCRTHYL